MPTLVSQPVDPQMRRGRIIQPMGRLYTHFSTPGPPSAHNIPASTSNCPWRALLTVPSQLARGVHHCCMGLPLLWSPS